MKITNIKESGSNNILKWAIANGADIKSDLPVQSIINDEMSYIITIEDVNFFELFRLTQMYRDKIRIVEERQAECPNTNELEFYFKGNCKLSKDKPDELTPAKDVANYAICSFMNLAYQMQADEDLIDSSALRLFLPMISRKFEIQVPVSFMDIMDTITPEDASKIFCNENYHQALEEIIKDEHHTTNQILHLTFLRGTSIVKYDKRYDELIKGTKYATLNSYKENTLYRFALIDFYKVNPINKEQIKVSMFKPDPNEIRNLLTKLSRTEGSLYLDFVVELPIQYMQMIENKFSRDILPIAYESSMSSIIEGGITYEDFKLPKITSTDEGYDEKIQEYENAVSAYKVRINEANQILLNAIPALLSNDSDNNLDVDPTATFSMIPSIYKTKAVFNINFDNMHTLKDFYEPYIAQLFNDIYEQALSVTKDIKNASK